jgi:diamine N-acetyltransferase
MTSLRPLTADDLDLIYEWENTPELWQFSEQQGPFSREDIEAFLDKCVDEDNAEIERWLICDLDTPIGAVDIFAYDNQSKTCGIGIFITQVANRNRGHATVALKQALSLLQTRGCRHIRAIIYEENTSSRRLFLSAGFREGTPMHYKGKPAIQFIWKPKA